MIDIVDINQGTGRPSISNDGYEIIRGFAPKVAIGQMQTFWKTKFNMSANSSRVIWNPYIGQPNHVGYSEDNFQCLYRACDYGWNKRLDHQTWNWCERIQELRSQDLQGELGWYATASFYPCGKGRMANHVDGMPMNKRVLVHGVLPLTFRGVDYQHGGMVIINRNGQKVDIESLIEPGDLVFYDASLYHGVEKIEGPEGSGRIQIFPISGLFKTFEETPQAVAKIKLSNYAKAKYISFKDSLRNRLGLMPNWR